MLNLVDFLTRLSQLVNSKVQTLTQNVLRWIKMMSKLLTLS